ncbi:MAG: oligosaccharide flippase family protein [Thermodesulfovibrionia bacterium]|nr:oligosaccharide flippase family protein [Thermodesulfovibrionia bacterium]
MKNSNIVNLVTSRSAKDLSLVITGNVSAAGLGFLAVLLISRELSVSDFGLFNMALSIMIIVSRLAELGMEAPIVKFTSSYLAANRAADADSVLRMAFRIRLATALIFAVLTFIAADMISTRLYDYPDLAPLIKLVSSGVLGIAVFGYIRSALHAYQLFRRSVMLQLLVDLAKFLAVAAMIFLFRGIDTFSAVSAFVFAPLLGVLLGFRELRGKLFPEKIVVKNLLSRFVSYSKWRFVSNICVTVLPYIGIFMIAKMADSKAAGIYGLAVNLTLIFPIITSSLVTVLLPRVSRFRQADEFRYYLKVALKVSLYIAIAALPMLFISDKIIPFFFGERYLETVPIFNWLLFSAIATATNGTIRVALFSIEKPNVVASVDTLKILLMASGCYILIPLFGTLAPAILALILNICAIFFTAVYVFRHISKGVIAVEEEEFVQPY